MALIRDQGYSVSKAAEAVGVTPAMQYKWMEKQDAEKAGNVVSEDERAELKRLRKEVKELRMEKEILKKASVGMPHHFFAKEMK